MSLPVTPPVAPMLARLTRELPLDGYVYEPKWDGFRCLAFRDGDDVDLRSRNQRPLARYFPEIVEALLALRPPRFVLDGELGVATRGGFDFPALLARLHPAASRVERLRRETPGSFVAFDLLALGDEDLRKAPFAERRRRYAKTSGSLGVHVHAPLSEPLDTKRFARQAAEALARRRPELVVAEMKRSARAGKVYVDWLQNDPGRQTVAPYSLRGVSLPLVATPLRWEELERAAAEERPELLVFTATDVLARIERDGDLFAPLA